MTKKTKSRIKRARGCWKPRTCTLQNVKSGCIVTAKSIAEFCRKMKLAPSVERHIPDVLSGRSPSAGGWYKPSTLRRRLNLRDIYGNTYSTDVRGVLQKKSLSSQAVKKLIEGHTFQGLFDATKDISHTLPPRDYRSLGYVFKDQSGETFRGDTIMEVAKKAGISYQGGLWLVHGYRDMVSGVYLKAVKTEKRQALSL